MSLFLDRPLSTFLKQNPNPLKIDEFFLFEAMAVVLCLQIVYTGIRIVKFYGGAGNFLYWSTNRIKIILVSKINNIKAVNNNASDNISLESKSIDILKKVFSGRFTLRRYGIYPFANYRLVVNKYDHKSLNY